MNTSLIYYILITLQTVRMLIDSASQINAVTTTCATRLDFHRCKFTAPLTELSGLPVPDVKGRIDFQIQSYRLSHSTPFFGRASIMF